MPIWDCKKQVSVPSLRSLRNSAPGDASRLPQPQSAHSRLGAAAALVSVEVLTFLPPDGGRHTGATVGSHPVHLRSGSKLCLRLTACPFAQWSFRTLGAGSELPFALTNSASFRLSANCPQGSRSLRLPIAKNRRESRPPEAKHLSASLAGLNSYKSVVIFPQCAASGR